MVELIVNGRGHSLAVDPDTPLLWVLREELGLTGTKYGCDSGLCGACTVLVGGRAVLACELPAGAVTEAVVTIEGARAAPDPAVAETAQRLERAWLALQVGQCGFCQPGMIMAALGLLLTTPGPTPELIDQTFRNLCRCGTYDRVRAAILAAAQALPGGAS